MLGLYSQCRRLNEFTPALQYGELKYLNKYVDKMFADASVSGEMYKMSKQAHGLNLSLHAVCCRLGANGTLRNLHSRAQVKF